jgi:hypothetical protein
LSGTDLEPLGDTIGEDDEPPTQTTNPDNPAAPEKDNRLPNVTGVFDATSGGRANPTQRTIKKN